MTLWRLSYFKFIFCYKVFFSIPLFLRYMVIFGLRFLSKLEFQLSCVVYVLHCGFLDLYIMQFTARGMWSTPQTLEHPFFYNGSDGVDHIMLVGKIQWFKVLVVCCLILFFIIVLFFFFLFMFFLYLRLSWMDVLLRMVWRSSW